MAGQKHLILIHGRSTKPAEAVKRRMVLKALKHGLDRADSTGAASRALGDNVQFSFVYYGDIANRRMLEKDDSLAQQLTARDPKHDDAPCEPAEKYEASLKALLQQELQTKAAYKAFLKAEKDRRWMDEAASAVSWFAGLIGLSDNVIRSATADMGAYLMERRTGSDIRQRLQAPLGKALKRGDDICLVSHSMGCIVSYDVLWKFSQMSEYQDIRKNGNAIKLWLTLGNPLGEPGVRKNLYDCDERDDGRFPRKIIDSWINIPACDDFVSHDPSMADDFKEMKKLNYLRELKDLKEVYTFWVGQQGANPHKFYGYLDNKTVATQIVNWMNS